MLHILSFKRYHPDILLLLTVPNGNSNVKHPNRVGTPGPVKRYSWPRIHDDIRTLPGFRQNNNRCVRKHTHFPSRFVIEIIRLYHPLLLKLTKKHDLEIGERLRLRSFVFSLEGPCCACVFLGSLVAKSPNKGRGLPRLGRRRLFLFCVQSLHYRSSSRRLL